MAFTVGPLEADNNLSEIGGSPAARTNLGLPDVRVTDAPFGAIDDGREGYFTATWVSNQASLSAYTYSGKVTVQNTGPGGVAVVTFPALTGTEGMRLGTEWCGLPIAIAGASGGVLVATVLEFYYDSAIAYRPTLVLSAAAPTPLTASAQQVMCPCFLPTDVGKSLFHDAGQAANALAVTMRNAVPLVTNIAAYVSPFEVTLATALTSPSATNAPGTQLVWGTDNSAAVLAAGNAAMAKRARSLVFPAFTGATSTGLFCLFSWMTGYNVTPTVATYQQSAVGATLLWLGLNGARGFIGDQQVVGNSYTEGQQRNRIIPLEAAALPLPRKGIAGAAHLRRAASQASTLVVCITGDSWATPNPSGTAANSPFEPLIEEIKRQNPGKTVHIAWRGIGGATWEQLASNQNISPQGSLPWIRSSSHPWLYYVQNCTVAGLGTVTPDVVVLGIGGANDAATELFVNDILTVINQIATWPQANGHAPDIILYASGVKGNELFTAGGAEENLTKVEWTGGINRSIAQANGIAFIDNADRGVHAVYGWSEMRLKLRQVPALPAGTAAQNVPFQLPYRVRDFFLALQLGGASGSSIWSAIGSLQVSLSCKWDNRLILTVDGSGNLNVAATTCGLTVPTTATLANGGTALSTSGQTQLPAGTGRLIPTLPAFIAADGSNAWTSGMVGSCLLAPGVGYQGRDYRSFLVGFVNGAVAFSTDALADWGVAPPSHYVGGCMFTPSDATAAADLWITSGGSTFKSKVAGYTSFQAATLASAYTGTSLSATSVNMFLGRFSLYPTYDNAVPAGTDAGANPILTIKKTGSRVRVGYVLGSAYSGTPSRVTLQSSEQPVWEGDVEAFGGWQQPAIWTGAGTLSVTPFYCWKGEPDYRRPILTVREAWGVADAMYNGQYGGDTSHPSHAYIEAVCREVMAAQDFST